MSIPARRLTDFIDGRDNNLNAIRLTAATAVLFSHSYAVVTGQPSEEPLRAALGVTPGTMAVDVFFVASGLLLANSLTKKNDAIEFVISRIARIYPALIVAIILTVFLVGPLFTSQALGDYFRASQTYAYLIKSSTLVRDIGYALPGVFVDTPLAHSINGSLWTLPFEIKMYGVLFLAWAASQVLPASRRAAALHVLVAILVLTSGASLANAYVNGGDPVSKSLARFVFFFFYGAGLSALQRRIPVSLSWLIITMAALLLGSLSAPSFFWAWHLVMGYALVLLAYTPIPLVSRYNRVGDYSYGMYIYAFPIQQIIVSIYPRISIGTMIVAAFTATLAMAILSWHLVESPAMAAKNRFLRRRRKARIPNEPNTPAPSTP